MKKKITITKIFPICILILFVSIVVILISLICYSAFNQKKPEENVNVSHEFATLEIKEDTPKASVSEPVLCLKRAQYKTINSDFYVETSGKTVAKTIFDATVSIKGIRIKKNNNYEILTISKGIISFAKLKYLDPGSNVYKFIETDKISDDLTPDFSSKTSQTSDKDKYLSEFGTISNSFTNYVINDQTILDAKKEIIDDNVLVTVSLNPKTNYAPFYYKNEIKSSSKTSSFPDFTSIELKVLMDDSYKVLKVDTCESYVINKFLPISTTTNVTDIFKYDNVEFDNKLDLLK